MDIRAVEDSGMTLRVQFGQDDFVEDHAAELMLVYTDCTRDSHSLEDTYQKFRQALSRRWGREVNKSTTYLVVEAVVGAVEELKKSLSTG